MRVNLVGTILCVVSLTLLCKQPSYTLLGRTSTLRLFYRRALRYAERVAQVLHPPSGYLFIFNFACHFRVKMKETEICHIKKKKTLSYSAETVKEITNWCKTCAENKPSFYYPNTSRLLKSTQHWEGIAVSFGVAFPSKTPKSVCWQ